MVNSKSEQVGLPRRAREPGAAEGALDNPADARRNDAREHERGSSLLAARSIESIATGELGNPDTAGLEERTSERGDDGTQLASAQRAGRATHWSDAEWIECRDGKARPVEPGTFPLAHGIPGRVGRLRAYGNAIVPQVAAEFIGAYMEIETRT